MKRMTSIIGLLALIFFSSCNRFIHWTYHTFHEPDYLNINVLPARIHLASIRAYHQFNTVAFFDILWLSDIVRTIYTDLYIAKRSKTSIDRDLMLRRQLQENNYFITFYVLMAESEGIAFKDQLGKWSFALDVNGIMYTPEKVRILDELHYEWRTIFGDAYTIFKTPYEIQFSARNIEGLKLITPTTDSITLVISSTEYREYCTFYLKQPMTAVHHEHNRLR